MDTGRRAVRGGLVFKAHRLVYHSTLGWRVIKKKKKAVRGTTEASKLFPFRPAAAVRTGAGAQLQMAPRTARPLSRDPLVALSIFIYLVAMPYLFWLYPIDKCARLPARPLSRDHLVAHLCWLFSSSLLLSSLELSDKKVYEPQIRTLLGTSGSHTLSILALPN